MNVLVALLAAAAVFVLAGRLYSRYIARSLGEDPAHPTPAVTCCDGRDYVPTKRYVVFAHHFSAIAGAGPILGPTMAILYGFVPAWLWVVFGGIFIGAVHDYTTLFVSMREGGKSMAEVARKTLGAAGFRLFIAFTLVMIVLVTSSFLSATSISLTSLWPLAKIGVKEGETFLKTVVRDGVVMGRIGGIASTSVIFITLCSPAPRLPPLQEEAQDRLRLRPGRRDLRRLGLAGHRLPGDHGPDDLDDHHLDLRSLRRRGAGLAHPPAPRFHQRPDPLRRHRAHGRVARQLRLPGTHRHHAAVQPGRRRAQPRLHLADDVHHHRLRGHFGVPLPRRRRDDRQAAVHGARRPARRLQRHAPRVAALGLRPPGPRRGHGLLRLQGHRLADRPGREVQSHPGLLAGRRASSSTRAWAFRSRWARSSASCSSRASSSRRWTPPSGSTATFSRSSGRSSSRRCPARSSTTGSTRACRSS